VKRAFSPLFIEDRLTISRCLAKDGKNDLAKDGKNDLAKDGKNDLIFNIHYDIIK